MLCEKTVENSELNLELTGYTDVKQNVWFRGKEVAKMLGYKDKDQAVRYNVDENDRKAYPVKFTGQLRNATFLNESGLYQLILSSKKEEAKKFRRWVTSEVLPSIRKYGQYKLFNNPNSKQFKIEIETDLHIKVTEFIRKMYPHCVTVSPMRELQDTSNKRIQCYRKGYMKGSPDLLILNLHNKYPGFCIEFKNPSNYYRVDPKQNEMLELFKMQNYKILLCNDYDIIIKEIVEYFQDVTLKCPYCSNKLKNKETLKIHLIKFHKIQQD